MRNTLIMLMALLLLSACGGPAAPASTSTPPPATPTTQAANPTTAPLPTTPAETQAAEPDATQPPAQPTADPTREQLIFYTAGENNKRDQLWAYDVRTEQSRQIAACPGGCEIGLMSVAPDGAQVAFASYVEGGTAIYVVPTAGGEPRLIASGPVRLGEGAFSPDGSQLVLAREGGGEGFILAAKVLVIDLASGAERELTEELFIMGGPYWADGERLLISVQEFGKELNNVLSIPAEGGEPTTVGEGTLLSLSPGGSLALLRMEPFTDNIAAGQRFTTRIAEVAPDALTTRYEVELEPGAMRWSADGMMIVNGGITGVEVLYVADGTTQTISTNQGKLDMIGTVMWMPGGGLLRVRQTYGPSQSELIAVSLADGSERVLLSIPGEYTPFVTTTE